VSLKRLVAKTMAVLTTRRRGRYVGQSRFTAAQPVRLRRWRAIHRARIRPHAPRPVAI